MLVPATGTLGEISAFFFTMLLLTRRGFGADRVQYNMEQQPRHQNKPGFARARVYAKINQLSLEFISSRQAGELRNRVVHDTSHIRAFMEHAFAQYVHKGYSLNGGRACIAMVTHEL